MEFTSTDLRRMKVEVGGEIYDFDPLEVLYRIGSGEIKGDTAKVAAAAFAANLDQNYDLKVSLARQTCDLSYMQQITYERVIDMAFWMFENGYLTRDGD